MGRDCLNGGYARIESLEFPVKAFKDFLSAERMPPAGLLADKNRKHRRAYQAGPGSLLGDGGPFASE